MKYILVIDNRENRLLQLLKKLTIKYDFIHIEVKTLPIGDVIIMNEHKEHIFMIERKTISDLASSILDGRYNEQSYRYDKLHIHNHNIIYIIEGVINDLTLRYSNIDRQTIQSAMISIQYFKGFSLYKTLNIEETASYILRLLSKLREKKEKKLYYKREKITHEQNIIQVDCSNNSNNDLTSSVSTQTENGPSSCYTDVVHSHVKNKNITRENIHILFLNQIPFVSHMSSKCIIQNVGTIYELIQKLKENENFLDSFKYTNSDGKERKLSKRSIDSIKHYLL